MESLREEVSSRNVSGGAPPPPSEMRVRTMKSDLQSLAASGGLPQFKSVPLAAVSVGKVLRESKGRERWILISAIAGALIVFVLAGYFFLFPILSFVGRIVPRGAPGATAPPRAAQPPPEAVAPTPLVHQSFLRNAADEALALVFPGAATSSAQLETYSQRLARLVAAAHPTSTFIEVAVAHGDGTPFSLSDFFSRIDAGVLPGDFLDTNLTPDFTLFVYRDRGGMWPGYLLSFRPDKNWLFLKEEIASLEGSPKIANLFVGGPGNPSAGGFRDDEIAGQPVRALAFSKQGAEFLYGWFHGYLVFSTSAEGLRQALEHF